MSNPNSILVNSAQFIYDEIYSDGGFYDGEAEKEKFLAQNNLNIIQVSPLFNSSKTTRAANFVFHYNSNFEKKMDIDNSTINEIFTICPKSVQIKFSECIICNNIIYIKGDNKPSPFYLSYRKNDANHVKLVDSFENKKEKKTYFSFSSAYHLACNFLRNGFKNNIEKERQNFFIGTVGNVNYGHWLIDDLPKIKALEDYEGPIRLFLISYGKIDKKKLQSLKFFLKGKDVEFVFIKKDEWINIKNLITFSPLNYHPYIKNINALNYIRNSFYDRMHSSGKIKKNIFILRNPNLKRSIINIKDLIQIAKKYDFYFFDPEKHSFTEQAKLFKDAKIIIGTMCAAMCNTIFSKKGAKTLYLAPTDWNEPFYWDLAATLEHEYNVIYAKRMNNSNHAHNDDFEIDVSEFEKLILRLTNENTIKLDCEGA